MESYDKGRVLSSLIPDTEKHYTTGSLKQNRKAKLWSESGQKTEKGSLETQVQFLFLSQPMQNT